MMFILARHGHIIRSKLIIVTISIIFITNNIITVPSVTEKKL